MATGQRKRILVLGASGMLGSTLLRYFYLHLPGFEVRGSVRSHTSRGLFAPELQDALFVGLDTDSTDDIVSLFSKFRPDVVVNCIGLVKQLSESKNPLAVLPVNAMLPHRLAQFCKLIDARLIHFSTDCVFSGSKGMYVEEDFPDADDLYGRSKLIGEVAESNCLTLRTSIIGHELLGNRSLVNWFLSQEGEVRGFDRAIFSGLPTVEIARVVADYVLPDSDLHGLFHLSATPINKFDLLNLIAKTYKKSITIQRDSSVNIDRSLNSGKFRSRVKYDPPSWDVLIESMQAFP